MFISGTSAMQWNKVFELMSNKESHPNNKDFFMKAYSNKTDAIYDLHKQGFTTDFHIADNDLLCIQENLFIRMGEFVIVEYYKIEESLVFGIIALHHNIKGILLSKSKNYSKNISPVLVKKLNELDIVKKHSTKI
jgi:hypothetical protein